MNDSIIQSLLVNLKVLSKVEENGRISATGCNLAIENNNLLTPIKRWFSGDSRMVDYSFIISIISQSIDCGRMLINTINQINSRDDTTSHENEKMISSLLDLEYLSEELDNSIIGIRNLIKTYRSDPTTVAKLEVIINKINTEVNKYKIFLSRNQQHKSNEN
jgi:hypothetical protein